MNQLATIEHPVAMRPESWAGAAGRGLEARHEREAIVKTVLIPGVDYKPIPGCGDKPVLHDCGAQKILDALNLWPDYQIVKEVEDWAGRFWFYRYRCIARQRGTDTPVSSGIGSCNSRESKYGFRWVPIHEVPKSQGPPDELLSRSGKASEFDFAIQKAETTGKYGKPTSYWQMFRDAISKGTATKIKKPTKGGKELDAWEIDTTLYRVINEDVESQVNTIDKMAQKRSRVASCIALGFGEWLTQDLEDNPESFGHVPTYGEEAKFETVPAVSMPTHITGAQWEQVRAALTDAEDRRLLLDYLGVAKHTDIASSDVRFVLDVAQNPAVNIGGSISLNQWRELKTTIISNGVDQGKFLARYAACAPCEIPAQHFSDAMGAVTHPSDDILAGELAPA